MNQEDELFGNDSDMEENEDGNVTSTRVGGESDVDENEKFTSDDFFGEDNSDYKNTPAFPLVKCPNDKILENYERGYKTPRNQQNQEAQTYFQFRPAKEKLISLENKEFERDTFDFLDTNLNAEHIINNYSISYSLKFDPYLNKYDTFSKKHHREKLYKLINDIDWENEYKIKVLKKEVNPYEDVFESYFDRRSSYKMANLQSIFNFQLFGPDYLIGYTPVMIVGDDGGYSDYIMWYANNGGFTTRIFSIPEKNAKIFKTTFRKEIDETKDEFLNIVNLQKGCDIDEVEDYSIPQIEELCSNVIESTDGIGVSLFFARKYIKFKKEFSQEIKYKKFLLLNLIIGLSVLSKGGNFVIKIYDMYTDFTLSVLFTLFNYFEKFTIIKPFSTRPHNSSRFVVCQKLTELKPKILSYLYELYEKYTCDVLKSGRDLDFIYPISKVINDDKFTAFVMDMNSLMAEQRIETLEEIKKAFEDQTLFKFDKMDIKKKCLELWKTPILHYDQRQIVTGRNILEEKNKRKEAKQMKQLTSIQDTVKIYSEYDKYSDSLKNMIDMFGSNKVVGSIDDPKHSDRYRDKDRDKDRDRDRERNRDYGRDRERDRDRDYNRDKMRADDRNDKKKLEITNSSNNQTTSSMASFFTNSNSKKKLSNASKLDQLKQQIIAERSNESYNRNSMNDTEESEDLLRRKREMLMSSQQEKSSSKSQSKKEPKKKNFIQPSTISKNRDRQLESHDKRPSSFSNEKSDEKSYSTGGSQDAKEIVKIKEKAIHESLKNRQALESKKVVANDQLLKELEKYKKK